MRPLEYRSQLKASCRIAALSLPLLVWSFPPVENRIQHDTIKNVKNLDIRVFAIFAPLHR